MTPIATHDDTPDDDENADGEKQVNPSGAVEPNAETPDDDQRNTTKNTEIHV